MEKAIRAAEGSRSDDQCLDKGVGIQPVYAQSTSSPLADQA
jgi:hypothetical protein